MQTGVNTTCSAGVWRGLSQYESYNEDRYRSLWMNGAPELLRIAAITYKE